MEQIYYTQCPMGHGLGATNGFQLKRRTDGYQIKNDLRHLGLHAFLPGTQVLAPVTLRYRIDDAAYEVASLTPRLQEYEAEDGRLWGRPGGQFAHGLRLSREEMESIACWPAGLLEAKCWCRSDPVPTMRLKKDDQPPGPITLDAGDLLMGGEFERVRQLAAEEPEDWLAGLLAAAAWAVRSERTVFLIDQPDRLAPLVALLTFAFPGAFRADLTFSTYHDRPEELAGYRIQGMIGEPRPNRALLTSLGIIADRASLAFEREIPVRGWARRLAGWLKGRDDRSRQAWIETDRRASRAKWPEEDRERWDDDWLDHLFAFHDDVTPPVAVPVGSTRWDELSSRGAWAVRAGLDNEWREAHGPSWWLDASAWSSDDSARAALRKLLLTRHAWRAGAVSQVEDVALARQWGTVVARWFARDPRLGALAIATLRVIPDDRSQGGFLGSLVQGLPSNAADALLSRIEADPAISTGMLLPIKGARLVAAARGGQSTADVGELLSRALGTPEATGSVLESIAQQVGAEQGLCRVFAEGLGVALQQHTEAPGWDTAWRWALARDDAAIWLGPYLTGLFASLARVEEWKHMRRRTPQPLLGKLARLSLDASRDPGQAALAFVWCVEKLLFPSGADLDADPSWPDTYAGKVCGFDLYRWVLGDKTRKPTLTRWLEGKTFRPQNRAKLDLVRTFDGVVRSGDASGLARVAFPDVPEERRGEVLELLLDHFGGTDSPDLGFVLVACRNAWNGRIGRGREGIVRVLARAIRRDVNDPARWLDKIGRIGRGLDPSGGSEFLRKPDGLAAWIIAETTRSGESEPWLRPLRQALFDDDELWKSLMLDVRQGLARTDRDRLEQSLERWDKDLSRSPDRISRFFELVLNSCDAAAALRFVDQKASELLRLGPLPSWGHSELHAGLADLRDTFVRLIPMAPLQTNRLAEIRRWLTQADPRRGAHSEGPGLEPTSEEKADEARKQLTEPDRWTYLSDSGRSRWRCIEALTELWCCREQPDAQWANVEVYEQKGPDLADLSDEDRERFLASLILAFEDTGLLLPRRLTSLARWLTAGGVTWDRRRIHAWSACLDESPGTEVIRLRSGFVRELASQIQDEQESARAAPARRHDESYADP
jgi:hypothetical protein